MALISLSASDLVQGLPIDPAWYKLAIEKIAIKTAKSGNSTNYNVTFRLISHEDQPTVIVTYNDQALGKMKEMLAAVRGCTVQDLLDEAKKTGQPLMFDTEDLEGKELQGRIEHEMYEGKIQNRINTFLPVGAAPVV